MYSSLLVWCSLSFLFNVAFSQAPCVWDYKDPSQWPSLGCKQMCGGSTQSPVIIANYVASALLGPLNLVGYEATDEATLTNKGYTIEMEFPETYEAYFKPGFQLKQFHFHTPAENVYFGVAKPLTMHMVHKSEEGQIAVLTLLFEVNGPDNPLFSTLFSSLPLVLNATQSTSLSFPGLSSVFHNMSDINKHGYVNFAGSLTTPPCTEGVDWYIFLVPQKVSKNQYDSLHSLMGFNYRPTQRTLLNVDAYVPGVPSGTSTPTLAGAEVNPIVFWVVVGLLIVVSLLAVVSLVMCLNQPKQEGGPRYDLLK